MSREQLLPSATSTGEAEEYGAPPLRVVPSEQLRAQLISPGYGPEVQVMSEVGSGRISVGGSPGVPTGEDVGEGEDGGVLVGDSSARRRPVAVASGVPPWLVKSM